MAPHHGLHHIGLVVPKRFGSKENVHQAVTADHLQDGGTGAEGATTATPISKGDTGKVWGRTWEPKKGGVGEQGNQKAGARSERSKVKKTLKSHRGWARELWGEKWDPEGSPRTRR